MVSRPCHLAGRYDSRMVQNPYESPQHYAIPGRGMAPAAGAAEYTVDCECGAVIPVRPSQAGSTISCRCGRVVAVPRLSQLRTAVGLPAHETNIRDSIARM